MFKPLLVLLLAVSLAACDVPKVTSVPLSVELHNDWFEADTFTVEVRPRGGEAETAVESLTVYPGEERGVRTLVEVEPGAEVEFRLTRVTYGDASKWVAFTVPAEAEQVGWALFRLHLATEASTPACPEGWAACVLGSWEGQDGPPLAF